MRVVALIAVVVLSGAACGQGPKSVVLEALDNGKNVIDYATQLRSERDVWRGVSEELRKENERLKKEAKKKGEEYTELSVAFGGLLERYETMMFGINHLGKDAPERVRDLFHETLGKELLEAAGELKSGSSASIELILGRLTGGRVDVVYRERTPEEQPGVVEPVLGK